MHEIFISYRRGDAQYTCDRVYTSLRTIFGKNRVFHDIEAIAGGQDFRKALEKALNQAKVGIVVIGPQWLTMTDAQGQRRLDDPSDFVRLEVETMLQRHIPVIPILIQGAKIPDAAALPPTLRDLPFLEIRTIRPNPDYDRDIQVLYSDLSRHVQRIGKTQRVVVGGQRMVRRVVGTVASLLSLALLLIAGASWFNIDLIQVIKSWFANMHL